MPTEILRPNAAGDETALSPEPGGGEANWEDVDESIPDTTTYVFAFSGGYLRDLYHLPAHSGYGIINFIKIYVRCIATGPGCYFKPSLKSNSTVTDGSAVEISGTWTTYSEQWNVNPADEEAWKWADIDALQIGISLLAAPLKGANCTQVYVEVNYTMEDWKNRIKIVIDHTKVDAALTHFPVMIRLSGTCGQDAQDMTRVFDELGAEKLKLAITQADGVTQLYVEVEKWDEVGEEAILWVSGAGWSISANSDTIIYLYYDISRDDNSTRVGVPGSAAGEAVWDANFVLVDHMRDDPDTSHTIDSTSNDNDGTKGGAATPTEIAGKIGEAQDFDGSELTSIAHSSELNCASAITVETLIYLNQLPSVGGDIFCLVSKRHAADSYSLVLASVDDGIHFLAYGLDDNYLSGTPQSLDIHTWYHVAALYDGANLISYLNGVQDLIDTATGSISTNADTLEIGRQPEGTTRYITGLLDEVRISNTARSAAWLKATYYACWDELISFTIEGYPDQDFLTTRIAFTTDPFADVPSWSDISGDLIAIFTKRGRQHQLDRFEAGIATILLKNLHGNYWPDNEEGIYSPEVKLGKRVNIRVVYDGTTYDEYTGFIRRWTPVWFSQKANLYPGMMLECADLQRNLAKARLNNAGYPLEKSGVRVGKVLTEVGWPAADRDIDTGKENMIATGALENVNPMEHLFKVQESELGGFFIRGDGYTVYHERGALEALESQATFGTGNLPIFDPEFSLDDDLLYNEVRLTRESGVEQIYSDAASILAHSLRTLARSGLLLTNDTIVYVYCLYLVARYHDVKMRIKSFTIKPQTPGYETTLWPLVLGLEIGQKITLVWTEAGINGDYFIESKEHSFDYRENIWVTKYQCSDAAQFYFEPDAVDETLYPNAAGDETNIPGLVGKPTHWEAVADPSTGTYVWHSSNGFARDLYNCESLVVENVVISKITVHALCLQEDFTGGTTGWAKVSCKSGVTVSEGDQESPDIGTWTDISKEWALNPDTGVAWTYDDIAALQIGVSMKGGGLGDFWIRCMRMWVVVDYIPAW